MKLRSIVLTTLLAMAASVLNAAAQAPPAPTPVEPANAAAVAQPVTLRWSPVSDPRGPVANYTWQVSTTSSFGVVAGGRIHG